MQQDGSLACAGAPAGGHLVPCCVVLPPRGARKQQQQQAGQTLSFTWWALGGGPGGSESGALSRQPRSGCCSSSAARCQGGCQGVACGRGCGGTRREPWPQPPPCRIRRQPGHKRKFAELLQQGFRASSRSRFSQEAEAAAVHANWMDPSPPKAAPAPARCSSGNSSNLTRDGTATAAAAAAGYSTSSGRHRGPTAEGGAGGRDGDTPWRAAYRHVSDKRLPRQLRVFGWRLLHAAIKVGGSRGALGHLHAAAAAVLLPAPAVQASTAARAAAPATPAATAAATAAASSAPAATTAGAINSSQADCSSSRHASPEGCSKMAQGHGAGAAQAAGAAGAAHEGPLLPPEATSAGRDPEPPAGAGPHLSAGVAWVAQGGGQGTAGGGGRLQQHPHSAARRRLGLAAARSTAAAVDVPAAAGAGVHLGGPLQQQRRALSWPCCSSSSSRTGPGPRGTTASTPGCPCRLKGRSPVLSPAKFAAKWQSSGVLYALVDGEGPRLCIGAGQG